MFCFCEAISANFLYISSPFQRTMARTQSLRVVNVVPHFMRLHDVIALQKGYFADEGLHVQFREDALVSTYDATGFPRQKSEEITGQRFESVNSACHWGVCNSAGAGRGKLVSEAYTVGEYGIFVRQESSIRIPSDLANVEVGVGELSGSHFTAIEGLEKYLPRERIKIKFIGGPATRLRKLLGGEVKASNLLPPECYIAKQLGMRAIIEGTFKILFWRGAMTDRDTVSRYFRALKRAQEDIERDPETAKTYWRKLIPEDFADKADIRKFGMGEKIIWKPYGQEEYARTLDWMNSWGLAERMRETSYANLIV
jgi:ABC-type nitrate/sulfonate/bicarbonate transport system substrate-binding protein